MLIPLPDNWVDLQRDGMIPDCGGINQFDLGPWVADIRQVLAANMIRDMLLEDDARFVASVQPLTEDTMLVPFEPLPDRIDLVDQHPAPIGRGISLPPGVTLPEHLVRIQDPSYQIRFDRIVTPRFRTPPLVENPYRR